ncbi:MAG: hypothetical protein HY561_13730 [Gemmatimonadetes bacterium]|nr:hypothetical protein [Gemmatimonadota bacterium]
MVDRAARAPQPPEPEEERERLAGELLEWETEDEGVSGEGPKTSGTLPGSVGGTTGTAGHSAGIQTPGATAPAVRGIDPRKPRRRGRRSR